MELTFAQRNFETEFQISKIFDESYPFDQAKNTQWKAFINNNELSIFPVEFKKGMKHIKSFILPVLTSINDKVEFKSNWSPPGPWI